MIVRSTVKEIDVKAALLFLFDYHLDVDVDEYSRLAAENTTTAAALFN